MKANRSPVSFRPVTITLESQDEVDKVHAIFNCCLISDALGLDDWFEQLDDVAHRGQSAKHHLSLMESINHCRAANRK